MNKITQIIRFFDIRTKGHKVFKSTDHTVFSGGYIIDM